MEYHITHLLRDVTWIVKDDPIIGAEVISPNDTQRLSVQEAYGDRFIIDDKQITLVFPIIQYRETPKGERKGTWKFISLQYNIQKEPLTASDVINMIYEFYHRKITYEEYIQYGFEWVGNWVEEEEEEGEEGEEGEEVENKLTFGLLIPSDYQKFVGLVEIVNGVYFVALSNKGHTYKY